MGFWPAVSSCFGKYVTFSGRSPRSEFWYWALFCWLASLLLFTLDAAVFGLNDGGLGPLSGIFSLAIFLPSVAVTARRLHDVDRSGWWMLIYCIPLIGFVLYFVWNCSRGTYGMNRFGNDPLPNSPTQGGFIPPTAMPPSPPPMA